VTAAADIMPGPYEAKIPRNDLPRRTRLMSKTRQLMNAARNMSLDLIKGDVLAAVTIARRAFVFVEEAARIENRQYKPGEKADVVTTFLAAMRHYAALTGMEPITALDLR
jgi:hypothetical protein